MQPRKYLNSGFSLMEILIALTIFSVFIASFLTSLGDNIGSSITHNKEILLKNLCLNKINQITIEPPELSESLSLAPQKGTFKEEGYPEYEFEIQYKHLKLPDFTQFMKNDEDDRTNETNRMIQKKIVENIQNNSKRILWQVSVTVNEIGTQFPYTLSSLLLNNKEDVKVEF